jgi:superfamily I DNA/RNA helicase
MARILPESLAITSPPEVHKTYRALKTLPDTWSVWHHLAPWQPDTPDFLVITDDNRIVLIKVSSATVHQAVPAAQLQLYQNAIKPVGLAETEVLTRFQSGFGADFDDRITSLVIFPNLPHRQVLHSYPEKAAAEISNQRPVRWAGKELLSQELGPSWEDFLPEQPLDPIQLERIRQAFSPEVIVPPEMTVRMSSERRTAAGLTGYLLDYNQEAAVKADLDLEGDTSGFSNDLRLNIINGVAGSGKTLILLYRLRLLYHLYPNKTFLVLTHNRPLIKDMESRFARLIGFEPANIEWRTFNAWCNHHWPKTPRWIEPVKIRQRERLVQPVWQQHFAKSHISLRMFMREIDWIKDQGTLSRAAYREIDRRGRGFGLSAEMRMKMYDAFEEYQGVLRSNHFRDWGDIPNELFDLEQQGEFVFPQYDVVLVDEAQFFAPVWFEIVQKLLKPGNPHLFVVADPTQGFLGRGMSWKSIGLQARGRSQQLKRSYRTTREILQFATLFYRMRVEEDKDDPEILSPDLLNMPNGSFPEMIQLTSAQDEIARVANEVEAFVKNGYPRQHLLALHANGKGAQDLKEAINRRLGRSAAMNPGDSHPGNYVRVTTLNAGAGLESPIVFLVGLRNLFEEEQSLRLSDEEREVMIRDNTRKIYMAATRAGQRLVFTFVGEVPEVMRKLLNT